MVVAIALSVAKAQDKDNDIIATITKPLIDNSATKAAGEWIRKQGGKIIGAAVLAPALWSLPKTWFLWVTLPSLAFLITAKGVDLYLMVFIAMSIRLFFKTPNPYARTVAVVIIAAGFFWFTAIKAKVEHLNFPLDDNSTAAEQPAETLSRNARSLTCDSFFDDPGQISCCKYPWLSCSEADALMHGGRDKMCKSFCWMSDVLPFEVCLKKCLKAGSSVLAQSDSYNKTEQ
jgi:hypothetical protein